MNTTFLILSTWLLISLALFGLGYGLTKRCLPENPNPFLPIWLGLGLVITIAQCLHFFVPLDAKVTTAFILLAGIAWIYYLRAPLQKITIKPTQWLYAGFVVGVGYWLANRALFTPSFYDSGLYHLNAIEWVRSYPVVPGLANFHFRLGFNTSSFLYAALLHAGPWTGIAHHLVNGFFFWLLLAQQGWALQHVLRKKMQASLSQWFSAFFMIPTLLYATLNKGKSVSSPEPDLLVFALGFIVLARLLAHIDSKECSIGDALVTGWLCLIGITIKLSFIFLGGSVLLVLAGFHLKEKKFWRPILVGGLLILGPYIARNIVLSGYPFYPLALGAVPVEWQVRPEKLRAEQQNIRIYARHSATDESALAGWGWLKDWQWHTRHTWGAYVYLAAGFFSLGLILLARKFYRSRRGFQLPQPWLILLPAMGAALFWFVSAPDVRFAGATIWGAALGVLLLGTATISEDKVYPIRLGLLVLGLLAPLSQIAFIEPRPPSGLYPVPTSQLEIFTTDSGFEYFTPAEGNQCWQQELLCSPTKNLDLRLRNPDDIGEGFVIQKK